LNIVTPQKRIPFLTWSAERGQRLILAENVRGAEKTHLIATTKSDPNKREGEFTLKKPTAGFPPGQYRVEIWQAGKMIYSEKFEIKSE
jgi:hypothetical protein